MAEELEEREPDVRELQEVLSSLNSLEKHPGYKWLMETGRAQQDIRLVGIILKPLAKMDEVLEQEYKKGEIAGIKLFCEFVSSHKQVLEENIQELLKSQETENAEAQTDGNE